MLEICGGNAYLLQIVDLRYSGEKQREYRLHNILIRLALVRKPIPVSPKAFKAGLKRLMIVQLFQNKRVAILFNNVVICLSCAVVFFLWSACNHSSKANPTKAQRPPAPPKKRSATQKRTIKKGKVEVAKAGSPLEKLRKGLLKIIKHHRFRRTKIGVVVMEPSGKILFQHNAKKRFIPASNTKLFTISTALDVLGPSYIYETNIYSDNRVNAKGVLHGNIYIQGSGDPSIRSEELWRIARNLYNMGVRKIKGRVCFDDYGFDKKYFGPGFKDHYHQRYRPYLAPIGALSLNYNTITIAVRPGKAIGKKGRIVLDPPSKYFLRTINKVKTVVPEGPFKIRIKVRAYRGYRDRLIISGTVPLDAPAKSYWRRISSPGWYFGFSFAQFLRNQGIRVSKWPKRKKAPNNSYELYKHYSPLLSLLLQPAGKNSSNFTTEQVLKTFGAKEHGKPGTWKKGLKVVADFLEKKVGIKKGYTMINGSGLGRGNRFTPLQVANLLKYMLTVPKIRPEFLVAQPRAGRDGTLRRRMKRSKAAGNIRAKTGTIDGVSSLSGYVWTQAKKRLIFAIMMNRKRRRVRDLRIAQNRIGILLSNYPNIK